MEETQKGEQTLVKRYLKIIENSSSCHYVHSDGYAFDTTPIASRGDFERNMSLGTDLEYRALKTQVLRYLSWTTYADVQMMLRLARMFAATQEIPNVVTNEAIFAKLMTSLVNSGAVCRRDYRSINGDKKTDLKCYCLTENGAGYFKGRVGNTRYIEEGLPHLGELEVMKRLATNYVLIRNAQKAVKCGYDVNYCESVRSKTDKGERKVLYGNICNDNVYAVFEPVFYMRDPIEQTEEELTKDIQERQKFLLKKFETSGDKKKKILVLVIENSSWLKRAYVDYYDVIEASNEVFLTTESLVNACGKDAPPFMRVTLDKEEISKNYKNFRASKDSVRMLYEKGATFLNLSVANPKFLGGDV